MAVDTRRNSLPIIGPNHPQRRKGSFLGTTTTTNNNNNNIRGHLKLLVAFLIGIFLDRSMNNYNNNSLCWSRNHPASMVSTSSIRQLDDLPLRNTSHVNPKTGTAITKKQLLEPFSVPRQTGFSVATIRAGEGVPVHKHPNMHEFFYVVQGTADFFGCGEMGTKKVGPGTFVHFVPRCDHGITVPEDGDDLTILISGVTVDE